MTSVSYMTDIRVLNDSVFDYKDVVVGGKKYGDIKAGATTDYQTWETAYPYASVMLNVASKPMQIS